MFYQLNKINDVTFIRVFNDNNLIITLCSYGASIYKLEIEQKNLVLSPLNTNDFYCSKNYYGKSIGRYSGRIEEGKCFINKKEYLLEKNWNNKTSLHGGNEGISFKNFDYSIFHNIDNLEIYFSYLEKENELPGDVNYNITYKIYKKENKFTIYYQAKTNKDTLVNLTNHSYFNFSNNQENILNHILYLNCNYYTELDNNLICKEIKKVNNIMDFTTPHKIGDYINDSSLLNHPTNGYDHCFIKNNNSNLIAVLEYKNIKLNVYTSYPAIVVYTMNYPENCNIYPNNTIQKYQGVTLECQYIPNGINRNDVNKAILNKNQIYQEFITYEFKTK